MFFKSPDSNRKAKAALNLGLLLMVSLNICTGQKSITFKLQGRVLESNQGLPLGGAALQDSAANISVLSDSSGYYAMHLVAGFHQIRYSYNGYKNRKLNLNLFKDSIVNIILNRDTTRLSEVIVNAHSPEKQIESLYTGTIELNRKEIFKVPLLLGESDFYKTFQLMPGVQTSSEADASLYVRGGAPDGNLILLDGATIYNPTHLLGFYSIFNSNVIAEVRMIKSGVPSEYGNRISSVLDFSTMRTVPDSLEANASIGIISTDCDLKMPVLNHHGFLFIAARKTYLNLILSAFRKSGIIRASSILYKSGYGFFDLNAGFMIRLNERDRIFFSSYGGRDIFNLNSEVIDLNTDINWGNSMASLGWIHSFNGKLYIENRLSYSDYDYKMGLNQNQYQLNLKSNVTDFDYKGKIIITTGNHRIKGGWEITRHNILPNTSEAFSDSASLNLGSSNRYQSFESGLFFSDEIKISANISISAGIRYSLYDQIGPFTSYKQNMLGVISDTLYDKPGKLIQTYSGLNPMITIRYLLGNKASIKLSYNSNIQYVDLVNTSSVAFPTDFWVSSSRFIKPQEGNQWSLGFYKLLDKMESTIELYYKTTTNQIEFKKGVFGSIYNSPIDENLIFGIGRSYGIEFLLRKTSGKLSGWLAYTISKSERSFIEIENGRWYPAKYDRRHDASLVSNYEFSPIWSFSAVFVYASGSAYTPVVGRYIIADNIVNQYGSYNSARMPSYNRLDISAILILKKTAKIDSRLIFSIYNVYNRKNAFFIYPETTGNLEKFQLNVKAREVYIFPVLPSVSWICSF